MDDKNRHFSTNCVNTCKEINMDTTLYVITEADRSSLETSVFMLSMFSCTRTVTSIRMLYVAASALVFMYILYTVIVQCWCMSLFLTKVLVTALVDTIRTSVLNIVMLLLLMMFLFAIMGYYFFGYKADSDKEHWGTLGDGMLTLFTFVTVFGSS